MVKAYAGIGSRRSPEPVLQDMRACARKLAELGYTLRTGGAEGADRAFYEGQRYRREGSCYTVDLGVEVYTPWDGFGGFAMASPSTRPRLWRASAEAFEIAAKHHPYWERMSSTARKLHARNVHQVLGADCKTPCAFVLCWTPDGAETETTRETGGTGMVIRVAQGVCPVVNMARPRWRARLRGIVGGAT